MFLVLCCLAIVNVFISLQSQGVGMFFLVLLYCGFSVDKTLAEAKEDLEECVCENLEDRLQNKQLRNLMELFRQLLRDLPRGRLSQTVQAAQRDINMLRPMINDALRDKPSDDLCALADWVKALLGDVQQK